MTSETIDGPTPNGGVRMTAYYRDDAGNPAEKELATEAEVIEFDARGNDFFRTHATLGRDVPAK